MTYWPTYIVGGFFVSLLLVDIYQYSWDMLPLHAALGILITGLYSAISVFLGNDVSMAVLFVPAVFILMFMLTSWLFYTNLKSQHCCMTCGQSSSPSSSPSSNPSNFSAFISWLMSSPPKKCKAS